MGLRSKGYGRLMAAGCVEGLHRFAQGATAPAALRVADCRSAAMLIKSALRDLLSVSYGMKTILLTGSLRSPPPIRLRRTSPRESVSHDSQVALLPYSTAITDSQYFARHCVPSKYVRWCDSCSLATPSGGQNKTSLCFPTESCNTTASVHIAPSKRGGKGTGVTPANWIRRGA